MQNRSLKRLKEKVVFSGLLQEGCVYCILLCMFFFQVFLHDVWSDSSHGNSAIDFDEVNTYPPSPKVACSFLRIAASRLGIVDGLCWVCAVVWLRKVRGQTGLGQLAKGLFWLELSLESGWIWYSDFRWPWERFNCTQASIITDMIYGLILSSHSTLPHLWQSDSKLCQSCQVVMTQRSNLWPKILPKHGSLQMFHWAHHARWSILVHSAQSCESNGKAMASG